MQGSLLTNCFHDDKITLFRVLLAAVAELADALDSKSSVVTPRAGSSPAFGTIRTETL